MMVVSERTREEGKRGDGGNGFCLEMTMTMGVTLLL